MRPFTWTALPDVVTVIAVDVMPSWQPAVEQSVACGCGAGGGLAWQELQVETTVDVHTGAGTAAPIPSWQYVPAHVFVAGS